MKINIHGCHWERQFAPTTHDNSVEPPIIETQRIFALILTQRFYVFNSKYMKNICYFKLQNMKINLRSMPLRKAGPTIDATIAGRVL